MREQSNKRSGTRLKTGVSRYEVILIRKNSNRGEDKGKLLEWIEWNSHPHPDRFSTSQMWVKTPLNCVKMLSET